MSAEDAHAEAERRFGDRQRIAAETPNTEPRTHAGPMSRVWRLGDTVRQDVVHAGRQLIRHPFASGLTLATLVVGVSATAIVYSVVDAVVLSPLPFEEPDALVHVAQTSPQGREYSTSEPNFVDFRERSRSFTEMAAMGWTSPILTGEGDPESIDGRRVSHTFFDILGTPFVLGRGFLPEEDVYGGDTEVALLSEGSWRRRFGSDPTSSDGSFAWTVWPAAWSESSRPTGGGRASRCSPRWRPTPTSGATTSGSRRSRGSPRGSPWRPLAKTCLRSLHSCRPSTRTATTSGARWSSRPGTGWSEIGSRDWGHSSSDRSHSSCSWRVPACPTSCSPGPRLACARWASAPRSVQGVDGSAHSWSRRAGCSP